MNTAQRSFKTIIGKAPRAATREDVATWLHALQEKGLSARTCSTYRSQLLNKKPPQEATDALMDRFVWFLATREFQDAASFQPVVESIAGLD